MIENPRMERVRRIALSAILVASCRGGRTTNRDLLMVESDADVGRLTDRIDDCEGSADQCRGLIYVWSDLMPLSELGMREVELAARDLSVSLTLIRAELLYERHNDDVLRNLVAAGGTVHYPTVVLYDSRGIQSAAIAGFKKRDAYRQLISERFGMAGAADGGLASDSAVRATDVGTSPVQDATQASAGSHVKDLEAGGRPGPYFRWVPGTEMVAYESNREVYLLDLGSGESLRAPGSIDFIPSPDGRFFVTPGPAQSGLEFYSGATVIRDAAAGEGAGVKPVFRDSTMTDQYPSIGLLSNGTGGAAGRYRVLTSWFDRVVFRDYEIHDRDGQLLVRPVGAPVHACPGDEVSLPIMSLDGQELAGRDERTASTKIYGLRADGSCTEDVDLGLQTGKVAWQQGGRRIAFAVPKGVVRNGRGVLQQTTDAGPELAGIFVYDRIDRRITRVANSADVERLAFPEFVGRDSVIFMLSGRAGRTSRFRLVWPVR